LFAIPGLQAQTLMQLLMQPLMQPLPQPLLQSNARYPSG